MGINVGGGPMQQGLKYADRFFISAKDLTMSGSVKVAIFDVDGVLIDSLPQHLQICRDKAVEFGLNLKVPSVDEFRQMVSQGQRISPMREFFLRVHFPEKFVDRAVADYERDFMIRYNPPVFHGADSMLRSLHRTGIRLALVTSNTRDNVVPALSSSMECFETSCLFFYDRHSAPRPKSWCLSQTGRILGVDLPECVYIGDQPADAVAAKDAGLRFLGVTYGWGILPGDERFETVDTIDAISNKLAEMSMSPR